MPVNNLPSTNTIRWTIKRKAEVVAAVHNGLIGLDAACERYSMSVEEFRNWEQLITSSVSKVHEPDNSKPTGSPFEAPATARNRPLNPTLTLSRPCHSPWAQPRPLNLPLDG